MKRLLLLCVLSGGCATAPLSAYEAQSVYQAACDAYRQTGDDSLIQVDVGQGHTAPLECSDYE